MSGPLRLRVDAAYAGKTVARLLHDRAGVSHSEAKGLVLEGAVRRNGKPVPRPDERLREGDEVVVRAEPGRRYRAPRRDLSAGPGFRVVHEDEDLVVADKDAGVLSVPVPSGKGEALSDLLAARYRLRGFRSARVRAVHRIDRFTSGLVAFSRREGAHAALRAAFAAGSPRRVYLAVAEGRVEKDSGRLVHHLVEDAKSLKVRPASDGERGTRASLSYRVIERFPSATLLEISLETGRRNQIRVQFAAEGHALVGDVAYGRPSKRIARVALHAWKLELEHPRTAARLAFEADPPADFESLVRALSGRRRGGHSPTRTSTPV